MRTCNWWSSYVLLAQSRRANFSAVRSYLTACHSVGLSCLLYPTHGWMIEQISLMNVSLKRFAKGIHTYQGAVQCEEWPDLFKDWSYSAGETRPAYSVEQCSVLNLILNVVKAGFVNFTVVEIDNVQGSNNSSELQCPGTCFRGQASLALLLTCFVKQTSRHFFLRFLRCLRTIIWYFWQSNSLIEVIQTLQQQVWTMKSSLVILIFQRKLLCFLFFIQQTIVITLLVLCRH